MSWASGNGVSPSADWLSPARLCSAWHGTAELGEVWVAMAARRAHGPSLPPSLADTARYVAAGQGMARPGVAWPGAA